MHPSRRQFHIATLGSAALLAGGCATVTAPPGLRTTGGTEPRERWARVLARFVDDQGRVAFEALSRERQDLDAYVAWINHTGPANNPSLFGSADAVLAYHVNAYNALAMHAILDAGIPTTLAGIRKVFFFLFKRVQVAGESISLYGYENKVIRALGDPRIHFALNCMSVGCPRLPREPFDAPQLQAQLERETQRFFADSRHLQVDDKAQLVRVSEILSFFTADFLAVAPTLLDYINRYRQPAIPQSYRVAFIPYDWTVNRQPSAAAA
jgi:Protein of unknown function, DUF547